MQYLPVGSILTANSSVYWSTEQCSNTIKWLYGGARGEDFPVLLMSWSNCVQSPWKPQQQSAEGIINHVRCYKRRRESLVSEPTCTCGATTYLPDTPPLPPHPTPSLHHQPISPCSCLDSPCATRPLRGPGLPVETHWVLSFFNFVCPKLFVHLGADSIFSNLCCGVCLCRSRGYFGHHSCGTHRRQHRLPLSVHFFFVLARNSRSITAVFLPYSLHCSSCKLKNAINKRSGTLRERLVIRKNPHLCQNQSSS